MMHNDLGQRLRALYATVRRVICGSGEPPYQEEYSVFAPLQPGMDYSPRPLPSEADDFESSPGYRTNSGREA